MKKSIVFLDIFFIVILNMLFFMTIKEIINGSMYSFICCLFSIYFLLVKLFLDSKVVKKGYFINDFFTSIIIVISALSLYVNHTTIFKSILFVFQILNIIFLYQKAGNKESSLVLLHIFLAFLIAGTYFSKML